MNTFVVQLPDLKDKEACEAFQKVMNEYHDSINEYVANLAKEMNISEECALDVWYLRTRSRHTKEKELELIELHKNGTPPNICEF